MRKVSFTTADKISWCLSRNRFQSVMDLNPHSATVVIRPSTESIFMNFPLESKYATTTPDKLTTSWFVKSVYRNDTILYNEGEYKYIIRGNLILEKQGKSRYNCAMFYDSVQRTLYVSSWVMGGDTSIRKLICTIYEAMAYHNISAVLLQPIRCLFPRSCNLTSDEIYDKLNEPEDIPF